MSSRKVIAIICARGGSKGIPKKNIREFNGYPLIAWTIRAASNAVEIDKVIVSSDNQDILKVAKYYGAQPHLRPIGLAQDTSTTESAVIDVLNNHSLGQYADNIVLIQATSPLTRSKDLDSALKLMHESKWDSVLSGVSSHAFNWQVKHGFANPINYDPKNRPRRQDISGIYKENGAFYIAKRKVWEQELCRIGGKIGIYPMEEWQGHEIDSIDDWHLIEYIAKNLDLNIE